MLCNQKCSHSIARRTLAGSCWTSFVCASLTRQTRSALSGFQRTEDLKVRCRDSTREKVTFPTTPQLLQAIHKCERVTAPEKGQGLPSNWGFSGFMKTATHHQVLDEVPFTKVEGDYLLKSELLAVTSIFYRQMNEMVWLPEKGLYMPKPIYKERFLGGHDRDIHLRESTHSPSDLQPIGNVPNAHLDTEGYIYNLCKDNYDKEVAFDVLKWIFCPSEPAGELAMRAKQ
ncbi:hypothetical protein PABG_06926 [Paracoccidioides brasiliensis Pb03]|nr:hypothetical protein PABG_06926 [Paracoccidioides brasiliensis Pb03]